MNDAEQGALLTAAAGVLDAASARFVAGIGAPGEVFKGHNDFATALDLELERRISTELTAKTGIPVHGEEFGGPELNVGVSWVLDPIDGTFNYSTRLPLCGMLLALVVDGVPTMGLTWLPLIGKRYMARAGGPVFDGDTPLPRLAAGNLDTAVIAYGNLDGTRGQIGPDMRLALLSKLSRRSARVRMFGSVGVDLAFVAAGLLGGAVTFTHHPWDNAAGVALVRSAGGVVTDLAGKPWTLESDSVLAAAPGVHDQVLELARAAVVGGES